MKKVKPLLTVLTVLIFVGAFFTAGFYNQDENESSSASVEFDGEGVSKEQSVGTEGGTTKRYIDISNPFTGAYLHEDMKIEGKAEIKESFSMGDVDAGGNVQSSVGEEDGTKDASVDVEESSTSEAVVEQAQGNSSGGNSGAEENSPGDQKDNNPEADNATGYILEPASFPEWADLF